MNDHSKSPSSFVPLRAERVVEEARRHLAERKRHCGWCNGKGFMWQNYDDYGVCDPKQLACSLCAETDRILAILTGQEGAAPSPLGLAGCRACQDGECPTHLGTPSHLGAPSPRAEGVLERIKAHTNTDVPELFRGWEQNIYAAQLYEIRRIVDAALREPPEGTEPTYGSEVLCSQCAAVFCPHGEQLHFHHDGCPACSAEGTEPPAQREGAALPNPKNDPCARCTHSRIWHDKGRCDIGVSYIGDPRRCQCPGFVEGAAQEPPPQAEEREQ